MGLELLLLRHGQTEWSRSGRHTSDTDLPLLEEGRAQALALAPLLAPLPFAKVLVSPLRRARETAELAGLSTAQIDPDLTEWRYGVDEGRTTAEILKERPGWSFWEQGCPGGETAAQVAARCDRLLGKLASTDGLVALVAHGHLLRVLIARWLSLPPNRGQSWTLGPASLTRLGHEHEARVIVGLNRSQP
jgi:broad specificity phosphatase PhoE